MAQTISPLSLTNVIPVGTGVSVGGRGVGVAVAVAVGVAVGGTDVAVSVGASVGVGAVAEVHAASNKTSNMIFASLEFILSFSWHVLIVS